MHRRRGTQQHADHEADIISVFVQNMKFMFSDRLYSAHLMQNSRNIKGNSQNIDQSSSQNVHCVTSCMLMDIRFIVYFIALYCTCIHSPIFPYIIFLPLVGFTVLRG